MDFKVDYKLEGGWSRTFANRYADDIIPLATTEAELQALVDRLDRVSRKYSVQPTHQRRQDQGNGERRHSVPHTHSEWNTGAGGYVPIPWVPDYRRWWVYDGIPYQVKQRAGDRGITAENMEKSQHTDFNEGTTNESTSVACSNMRLWKIHSERMKKHILTPLKWKDWERFCRFHGQQRKRVSS